MSEIPEPPARMAPRPQYRWPWVVAALALLGVLLAVLWMSREVDRTRRLRQWNTPAPVTNTSATQP